MSHLDEIRVKLSIEEVVSGYLQLKKAGRNLRGLCPFHSDSHPSFTVSPEKGIGYCFSCNTGGDIFKFVQLIEKVDFPEAVRILAERAGVALPEFKPQQKDERIRLLEINRKTEEFFAEQLKKHPAHTEYLIHRGLTPETIEAFHLGYALDSFHALKDRLKDLGFNEKDMLLAGVISQRSIADQTTYDRFRSRIIFPIHDHQGNTVGFGGRIVGDGEPKYLNSPDTPLYNKSFTLYALNHAKEAIKEADMAIFVEGYMDVIAAHQAGSKNVIATCGTALTAKQLNLIKRYTKKIAFALDQDRAGQDATQRAIEIALEDKEMHISVIRIPEGKDPDECIKDTPEKWHEAVRNPVPVLDFYLRYYTEKFGAGTVENRTAIVREFLPMMDNREVVEKDHYIKKLSSIVQVTPDLLWKETEKPKGQQRNFGQTSHRPQTNTAPPRPFFSREEYLLGFIFNYPLFYPIVHENLIDHIPSDPATERFYKAVKNLYSSGSVVDIDDLKTELTAEESEKVEVCRLLVEEHYPDFSEDAARKEMVNLIREINRKNLHQVQKQFEVKIHSAADIGEKTILLNQYNQIIKLKNKV